MLSGARPLEGEGGAFDANSDRTLKGGGTGRGHASQLRLRKKLKDWRFGLIAFPTFCR